MRSHPARPPQIRAITFDVGGTLLEPWPSVGHIYAAVAIQFGLNPPAPATLTQRFGHAWKARPDFDYSREGWFALVRETFADHGETLPAEFFPTVYDRFAEPEVWRLFDDVLPTLDALCRSGLKLGVISNWDDRLRPLLHRLGLTRYFQSIVVSCEVGATKPAQAVFARSASELGVAPGELLHVGDSLIGDVLGAERSGATGRQIERHQPLTDPRQLRSLAELIA
jgi:putative hydrolase of the HAD superfamily